jgi:hypothetical protein
MEKKVLNTLQFSNAKCLRRWRRMGLGRFNHKLCLYKY